MPLFKLDVEKLFSTEYWTNRYFLHAADLADAASMAPTIVNGERNFHLTSVTFTKWRVSDPFDEGTSFITTPINLAGLRTGSGDVLALFNTVRVDFPAGFGRPSRKYYRGVLTEADIVGATLAAGVKTLVTTNTGASFVLHLVDPQDTNLSPGVVSNFVQMRQLRRGRRKRTTPVIP